MLERTDFEKKQIVFFFPAFGDKMSFKNDNLVIKNKEGEIRLQVTCYRVFLVFVAGDVTITTGLLSRANKFGFSICFMNRNMKIYKFIGGRMEGNTLLRKKQYVYVNEEISQYIIKNKIQNQRNVLMAIRNKNELIKEAITTLNNYIERLNSERIEKSSLLGIEGSASRVYFSRVFDNVQWKGRKPRIKPDEVNASLDIGYTIVFNIIDALLNVYGFDEYYGVLHTCYYMRKSLVCDIMEPFRPLIDYTTRKAINLKQIKKDDFKIYNSRYVLEWKKSPAYTKLYLEEIMKYKNEMFMYIQEYYRAFMKEKPIEQFPIFIYRG